MSPLRWTLVALLVVSTGLFAVGVIAERSDADEHTEATAAEVSEQGEGEAAHEESPAGEAHDEEAEALLGIDVESTPLVALAVIIGLAIAALTATRLGQVPAFLLAVAVIALAWAVLDVREFLHQLDESRTGIALVAIVVAVLHLAAAAVSGRLASRPTASP